MDTSDTASRIGGVIDFLSEHVAEIDTTTHVRVLPYDFGPTQYASDELDTEWWSKQLGPRVAA